MVIDVNGPDGNAFQIMTFVKQFFKETDRMDEWDAVRAEMMSGGYESLLETVERVTFGIITFKRD
jgi:hypothetical protein